MPNLLVFRQADREVVMPDTACCCSWWCWWWRRSSRMRALRLWILIEIDYLLTTKTMS